MTNEIPTVLSKKGIRRLYYVSSHKDNDKEVIAIIITPKNIELPAESLITWGYGIYYLEHLFNEVGKHLITILEEGIRQAVYFVYVSPW